MNTRTGQIKQRGGGESRTEIGRHQPPSCHMIYLISCSLQRRVPEKEIADDFDLLALYRLARFHSLTAIVCMALETTDAFHSAAPELRKKWTDARDKAIRKNMLLDAERAQIMAEMSRRGIWHMPLKGSVLQELYPKYGMRQMADNDILFDSCYRLEMADIMKRRGYTPVSVGQSNHDVYKKPPIYNFEMHVGLFGESHKQILRDYYANIKERLLPDSGDVFGYHFSDEDFYVYVIAHMYKHFSHSGTGLRSLVDIYVYIWKKEDTLDWDYIRSETEKLEIAGFEQNCRELARKLFSAPVLVSALSLTEEEAEILRYFTGSGTYGTIKNNITNKLKEMEPNGITARTRYRYLWARLFPERGWFIAHIPVCAKHHWLIPFYRIFRIIRGVIFRGENIKAEISSVKAAK